MAVWDLVHVEHGGRLTITIATFPVEGIDRRGTAVQEFRASAAALLVPGLAISTGADDVPPDVVAPLVTFYLEPEHLPLEEKILEWLRRQPIVRLIEIERYAFTPRPPDER